MKKIFFLLISIFAIVSFVKAQTVPREMVALEITTSTKCPYCPGAALGAEDLLANGKLVAVIEHHNNWQGSDPYVTTASQARCVTLGAGGNPTAYFDVKLKVVGGDHTEYVFLLFTQIQLSYGSPFKYCNEYGNYEYRSRLHRYHHDDKSRYTRCHQYETTLHSHRIAYPLPLAGTGHPELC